MVKGGWEGVGSDVLTSKYILKQNPLRLNTYNVAMKVSIKVVRHDPLGWRGSSVGKKVHMCVLLGKARLTLYFHNYVRTSNHTLKVD